jgi:hypothetical protein
MVLDLRLNEKIGLSGDNLLFFSFVGMHMATKVKVGQPAFFYTEKSPD